MAKLARVMLKKHVNFPFLSDESTYSHLLVWRGVSSHAGAELVSLLCSSADFLEDTGDMRRHNSLSAFVAL